MRGLKIIPLFLAIILLSYGGMLFVEANHDPVVIKWWHDRVTAPTALGLVVLTSMLIGMAVCGLLCSVEMLALYMQNQKLRKKIATASKPSRGENAIKPVNHTLGSPIESHKPETVASGRFQP